MGKISPVSAKYIIHANIDIEGVVDKPDVVGAIFGQTEGLLGADLELRELQKSGRIGRIEVNVETRSGKTKGNIVVPSSLDKAETAIVGAALEIIQRIGPCNAKMQVENIEDVRVSKRGFVIERAKELLKNLMESSMPDSQEIADEVAYSVRVMEIREYGKDRLPAGPAIDESDEVVVVEGRADVLNLLKHGFKNAIAMNGTSVPETIKELTRRKTTTAFVDGDRGGNLIIRELLAVADLDFVCKAPDGKEVEEITKKEIHKSIRCRITAEQSKLDLGVNDDGTLKEEPILRANNFKNRVPPARRFDNNRRNGPIPRMPFRPAAEVSSILSTEEKRKFKETMDDLFGTRGACIFDQKLNILGKVPLSELGTTLKSLNSGVHALVMDGNVDPELAQLSERVGVKHIVATSSKMQGPHNVNILTDEQL